MNLYIFDMDGVMNDPFTKEVEVKIFDELLRLLEESNAIAFNTGRGEKFIFQKVIRPFSAILQNHNALRYFSHIFAVGEKGGITMEFNDEVSENSWVDPEISIPLSLQQSIHNLIKQTYSSTMQYDATKKTMISTEIRENIPSEEYHKDQEKLFQEMKRIIQNDKYKDLIIDKSISAIDIQRKETGKHLGAQRILQWIEKKNFVPDHFYCFGDSAVDRYMAREFAKGGKDVTFIYVGQADIPESEDFKTVKTKAVFTQGTLEYLSSITY